MTYFDQDEGERQESFIESVLEDVTLDKIERGDDDLFDEALGIEGFASFYKGDRERQQRMYSTLRYAIASGNREAVGKLVINWVTSYVEDVAREEIEGDLEKYGYNAT